MLLIIHVLIPQLDGLDIDMGDKAVRMTMMVPGLGLVWDLVKDHLQGHPDHKVDRHREVCEGMKERERILRKGTLR